MVDLDPAAAEKTLNRLRSVAPRWHTLNEGYASLWQLRGDAIAARTFWERQIEATPFMANYRLTLGVLLRTQGDFGAAALQIDAGLRLVPRGGVMQAVLAASRIELLIDRGDVATAKAEFDPLWADHQHTPYAVLLGPALARLGRDGEARAIAAMLIENPAAPPALLFWTSYWLGDYDTALAALRRVIDERDRSLLFMLRIPNAFPGLQEQPGFAEMLAYLDSVQRSR